MSEPAHRGRCYNCGYDMRGISSKVCPECGESMDSIVVQINDSRQFHLAHAALEKENLLVRFVSPGGSIGVNAEIAGDRIGWLWIRPDAAGRAEEILDTLGIVTSLGARPIVDRSEPFCPKCNAELDLFGRPQCAACGTLFDWVEIEVPTIDPTHLTCDECGYELTGLASARCPECNCPIETPERLVTAAMTDNAWQTVRTQSHRLNTWRRLFSGFVVLAVISAVLAMFFFANPSTQHQAKIAIGVLLGSMAGMLISGALRLATKSKTPNA